jgi:hypothetical protein
MLISFYDKELMLKKGLAWHYAAYDKRPELETVSANDVYENAFGALKRMNCVFGLTGKNMIGS